MIVVPNKIKKYLDEKDKTRYWLARESGISTQSIYNILKKDVDIDDLKYKTVRMIANALNVEIEDLRG